MNRFIPCIAAVVSLVFGSGRVCADEIVAVNAPVVPLTAKEIDDCVHANVPDRTSRQFLSFKVTDRSGLVDESTLETFWKKYPDGYWRLLARFLGPENVRGTTILMYERDYGTDIFVYLPDLRRVRRINKRTMSGAIAGTDLTYEDWERLQGLANDADLKRLPDSEIEGRPAYVLEALAAPDAETSYTRIVSWVDARTCVVLRSEIYEKGDRLRKVVTVPANAVWPEKTGWIPHYSRVEDRLDGSQTEVFVEDISVNEGIDDKYFSQKVLESSSR